MGVENSNSPTLTSVLCCSAAALGRGRNGGIKHGILLQTSRLNKITVKSGSVFFFNLNIIYLRFVCKISLINLIFLSFFLSNLFYLMDNVSASTLVNNLRKTKLIQLTLNYAENIKSGHI